MKKSMLTLAVVFFLSLLFASCQKSYVCTCTTFSNNSTVGEDYGDLSKSEAQALCDSSNLAMGANGVCTLGH